MTAAVTTITLEAPRVSGQEVRFAFSVDPAAALYRRPFFELRFPAAIDPAEVPGALWWRIALLCLHSQWPLMRPCRVVLPVTLEPGERELWLRLIDSQVATLEALQGTADRGRDIEIHDVGPPVAPLAPSEHSGRDERIVVAFSGGRDSLTQVGLLMEIGERPLLVTTTSPVDWSHDHSAHRRRMVLDEISRRRPVELIEVQSDLRGNWENTAVAYPTTVNQASDTFLYTAVALAVAAARGCRLVLLASETEVQASTRVDGMIVQHKHSMYSAATQAVLSSLLEPTEIRHCGLTYPLAQFQVQQLLSRRYPELRDLQFSCWSMAVDEAACSRCPECLTIAMNLIADGISPMEIGIDSVRLLRAIAGWRPRVRSALGQGAIIDPHAPNAAFASTIDEQILRCLRATTRDRVAALIEEGEAGVTATPAGREALDCYDGLREFAAEHDPGPEPGYREGFLALVDASLRDRLRAIYDSHFARAAPGDYSDELERSGTLARWITAPLRASRGGQRRPAASAPDAAPYASTARPPEPAALTTDELEALGDLVPGPEPELGEPEPIDGEPVPDRPIAVADVDLGGNELEYVSECIRTGWVSSAGSFVRRFEEAFAERAGAAHAIACSSGTAALQLALAAAGIGPGDEVLVPSFTMIATVNAVLYVGATPVLVDADPVSWNVHPGLIAGHLSPRTAAIVVVHTYGRPADMHAINDLAARNGLVVIEDAAEAHGAEYDGRRVGSLGAAASFSFYGNKIVTTGEGGAVTTDDERLAAVARSLRDHAFSSERHFWHRHLGYNLRVTNLQAAVGLAQTERLDELLERRRVVAAGLRERLAGTPGLELQAPDGPRLLSVPWVFAFRVGEGFGCSRDELRAHLARRGIETRTFFVPMHLQPIHRARFARLRFPVAEQLGRSGLYTSNAPLLSQRDLDHIAREIVRATRDGGTRVDGHGSIPASA